MLVRGPAVRFCLLFLGLMLASYGLLESSIAWRHLREPFCNQLASLCGGILGRVLDGIQVSGNQIVGERMSVSIVGGCDALNVIAIFCSAVVAFPGTVKARATGIVLGVSFLFVANVVRIVVLFVLGTHWPWTIEMVHLYVFQVSLVAATAGAFFWWAQRAQPAAPSLDSVGREVHS